MYQWRNCTAPLWGNAPLFIFYAPLFIFYAPNLILMPQFGCRNFAIILLFYENEESEFVRTNHINKEDHPPTPIRGTKMEEALDVLTSKK
jgi:hypothetical protein